MRGAGAAGAGAGGLVRGPWLSHLLPMQRFGAQTTLGPFWVGIAGEAVVAAGWGRAPAAEGPGLAEVALVQLAAYLARERRTFDLPLAPQVSAATGAVLAVMRAIAYGETLTYGAVAQRTGLSAQAVGQACGANPIPVFIPCHRILGTGNLGGFSAPGGVETKVKLLLIEGAGGLLI